MRDVDRAIATRAGRQHGLVSRAQVLRLGASARMVEVRLANGMWEREHEAVYRLAGYTPTWQSEVMAACLLYGPRAFASHRSAGALHGLGNIRPREIEVTVPRGHARPRPGIRLSPTAGSLHRADTERVVGIPVTSPARTLFDLASAIPREALQEAVDDALVRRLVTQARLRWLLAKEARPGRPGIRVMRALLADRGIGDRHESVPEARLGRLLRRARIDARPQHPIRHAGRAVARVDFAIPELRIAIVVDGYRWHGGRGHWAKDLQRRDALTALGWQVLHVTPDDLERDAARVLRVVGGTIRARATRS